MLYASSAVSWGRGEGRKAAGLNLLAELTAARARLVVGIFAAILVVAAVSAPRLFELVEPFDISDPDSETERAYSAYEQATGEQAEAEVVVLVESGDGRAAAVAESLRTVPAVARVLGAEEVPELRAPTGDQELVIAILTADANRVEAGEEVVQRLGGRDRVTPGGVVVAAYELGEKTERDTREIELYAAPVLLLLCLLVFRTVVAALLPILVAAISITLSFALLRLIAAEFSVDLFSLQVVTGLGVGLAVDYSLFLIARFRTELASSGDPVFAHRRAMQTAGRAIAFSALTIAAALAALIVFPNPFLRSTGVAGALISLSCGLTALTLLPAVLALLGGRINRGGVAGVGTSVGLREDPPKFWQRLPRLVLARPLPIAALAAALMVAIALPGLDSRLTTPDARELPEGSGPKLVAETAAAEFPALPETRLLALLPRGANSGPAAAALGAHEAVSEVLPPERLSDGRTLLRVHSELDPLSAAAEALVADLRDGRLPAGSLLGGRASELVDQRASIGGAAPAAIALVVLATLALLVTMLRAIPLPLIALVLNALTVGASYGIMVAVFGSETLAGLVGTSPPEGISISVPILTFAVVFGLSTDYGIFLLSRIREARDQGLDDRAAIAEGLRRTGRLITAAAVIFSVAVGAFVFSDLVIVKESAVAISIAVLLDATVIRTFLLPSLLVLLGSRAWWWPSRSRPAQSAR
jgi:uncharacterized membrane protein YdfJ with MMPL/SSD domain